MALKSILIDEDENDEELNEELQTLDESEIALLTRQLRRVLQSKAQRPNYSQNYTPNNKSNYPTTGYNKGKINQSPNGYNNANNNGTYTPPKPKEQNPEETPNVCFECKQPGHFKRECPKLSKGRILVAENGWDLSEDEETSEATEEVVNLCLMALEDDSSSSDISTSNDEVSSRTKLLHNMHLFNDSSLNLLDMSKSDLIDLLVEMNERNNSVNQHTLSRISELNLKHEEEVSSLCEQNDFLKNENNKYKDVVTKLEIENISLVLNTEELENEKLQLNENTRMLHVDLLNLKIQNESLAQGKSNSVVQKDNDELVHALSEKDEIFELETQRLKDEHSKILAQVMDQERILNDKINILSKEKDDLERTIQKFTKGNELLDKMIKNGEIKGKYMWVRKGTKPYTKVDRFVPNNYVDGTQRKPKFSYVQKPIVYQNRNSGYKAYTNGQSSRSHFVPSHRFYPQNTMYYSNDRNNMYQGGNYQKPRYYDYSRNNASRNSYVPTHAYTMPSFYNANVCLVTKQDMWYLDSGCSRHTTGNKSLLKSIRKVTAGSVTFGDSSKGSIIGIGDIGNEHFKIANVQLVTGLKYNLLSISQLCDNGYKMTLGYGIVD
nr:PREDICTED: RING finger protein PFF0165c-like [Daucus carota subsp. sativus]